MGSGTIGVPQAPEWRRGGPWAPGHAGHLCHLPRGPDHNDDPFQGFGASSPWRPVLGISDLACPHCSSVPSQALRQNALSQLPTTPTAVTWPPASPQACPALSTPAWACPLSTEKDRLPAAGPQLGQRLPNVARTRSREPHTRPPNGTHFVSQKSDPTPGSAQRALQSASRQAPAGTSSPGPACPATLEGPPQARGVPACLPHHLRLLSGTFACLPAQVPAV